MTDHEPTAPNHEEHEEHEDSGDPADLGASSASTPVLPVTPLLDRPQQLQGWRLNKMAQGLGDPANRRAFSDDERGYLARFGLTEQETAAVMRRDWKTMIALGGNLFFLLKISAVDPVNMTEIGAAQADMDHTQFLRERLGKDV